MLKTTGITKKFEEMKNGGYTLFSDKTRKMLLAMGLSLLSIGVLGQAAYAQMSADVTFKKTARVQNNEGDTLGEGKTRYQMTIKEDDPRYKLDGVYLGEQKLETYVGNIEGKTEALVVVEVPSDATSIVLKNDNEDDIHGYTIDLTNESIVEDNDGPEIEDGSLVQYETVEEKYLQAKFNDATKIYRVEDQDKHNRVVIKEKDRDKVVNLKYILEDDDDAFTIYDILGNPTTISLDQTVPVVITYHTRNVDGTQLALDVDDTLMSKETVMVPKLDDKGNPVVEQKVDDEGNPIDGETVPVMVPEEVEVAYKLVGMKTGAGQDIPMIGVNENVYTSVPSGTTKMVLIYEEENPAEGEVAKVKRVTVPLVLDRESPVVVAYKATGSVDSGYEVEESAEDIAKARAYINGKKAIVEVRDVKSGISKIQLLKGKKGSYVVDDTTENSIVYDDKTLQPSLLKVFDVTPNTTAVRVYDGVGNTLDLELGVSNEPDAITIARLKYDDTDNKYKIVAQDIKAGLGSIKQSETTLADFTGADPDKEQYTLKDIEIVVDENGYPIIEIYDALGNKKSVSFDEFLYRCIYATYSEHNDCTDSGSVSINVKDERGICRIEVIMVDAGAGEEPAMLDMPTSPRLETQPVGGEENFEANMRVWNAWKAYDSAKTANETWNAKYRHTYTLEKFRGTLPKEVIKTYAIPDGTVESVMIYTKYVEGEDGNIQEFHNTIDTLINRTNVVASDRIKTSTNDITKDTSNRIIGAKVASKYGIKQVTYEDSSVVRFYNELPTELYVNCLIAKGEGQVAFNGAVVMDALGDTLTIKSDKITFSYNDNEIK